ncbi:MAG: AAA family ATPase [Chloroflexi bacterium]|nr:AAA family ATPase [Chloroflexota bacterium]
MKRVNVIGTSGSGKTTFARDLARQLGCPHIELDALHWEPNWVEASREVFRARVELATRGETWTLDGNYSKARDIVWGRADTVVWLDYTLSVVLWRVWWRTIHRGIKREELWNGNRENLRMAFLSRDSILLWSLTTYHRRRKEYPALFARPEHAHLTIVRLPSPREAMAWMARVKRET